MKEYFPKTWKFISQKGSIKNFYDFNYNINETRLINNKFVSNKIDFINIEYKTPLHVRKTPYIFYGFSTNNIINDDLQYLNVLEKLKNTLFSVKIKIVKTNDKLDILINKNDFRIPIVSLSSFNNIDDFELRFAYYLKLLLDYEYLTYEIIYKDASVTIPYWTFVTLPISYIFFKESEYGQIYRTVVSTLVICLAVAAIVSLYVHSNGLSSKLKEFGYYDKYLQVREIIKEDSFNFKNYFSKLKEDLQFLKKYIQTPLEESQNIILQEGFIFNRLKDITSGIDDLISNNTDKFIHYFV